MSRPLLYGLSIYFFTNAALMWAAPQFWYEMVPGVLQTGGFNSHFIRDVALAFVVSALALASAAHLRDQRLALFGAAWPGLHAVFHIWIWAMHREATIDLISLTNLLGIQVPAWAAFYAAIQLNTEEASQ
ncbi:MAG: hypothetical protein JXR15_19925 [Shimia sp.]|uniref:hypothetical protein n=1 Tax=Shimia sp. TaxID=1954381 RepID=UPI003B8E8B70